ncbi:hypothetical protein P3L51_08705 [Streptomyces sp. PSRA5]|uniref:hypothetical protein n=1 Tax=Streptomyces panacea TaxID=3035064 RepID=UPI00339BFC5B
MNVSGARAGFCHALALASDAVRAGSARHVLVVGAERDGHRGSGGPLDLGAARGRGGRDRPNSARWRGCSTDQRRRQVRVERLRADAGRSSGGRPGRWWSWSVRYGTDRHQAGDHTILVAEVRGVRLEEGSWLTAGQLWAARAPFRTRSRTPPGTGHGAVLEILP